MSGMRQELLRQLLQHKDTGVTTAELSSLLGISRNAVQQHLLSLERDGMVAVISNRRTPGRPGRAYGLTEKGYEGFPRNYAGLAEGVIATLRDALGAEATDRVLAELARRLSAQELPRLERLDPTARLAQVAAIMNDLGYDAAVSEDGEGLRAANCVYHRVARQTRAVCRFDVALLSGLLGGPVDHTSCMLDGSRYCSFEPVRDDGPVERNGSPERDGVEGGNGSVPQGNR